MMKLVTSTVLLVTFVSLMTDAAKLMFQSGGDGKAKQQQQQPAATGFESDEKKVTDVVCPDGGQCPDGNTCCLTVSGYGCCPFESASCCSDGKHCCAFGYFCTSTGDCVRSSDWNVPWSSLIRTQQEQTKQVVFRSAAETIAVVADKTGVQAESVVCPDGNICPDGNTCCLTVAGYGCCPFDRASCCADGKHCCAFGYICTSTFQCVRSTDVKMPPWASLAIARHVAATEGSETAAAKTADVKKAESVVCPDGSECPDGNTCCLYISGGYACCSFDRASCCNDGLHCCAFGYRCSSTGDCVRSADQKVPWASL